MRFNTNIFFSSTCSQLNWMVNGRRIRKRGPARRKAAASRKIGMSKPATRALVSLIKKTVMKQAETKRAQASLVIAPMYHNTPYVPATNLLFCPATTTIPGLMDTREGDEIQAIGISFRFLFMTYADRPNVTFKIWVIKTPAYDASRGVFPYTYNTWFDARTSQFVLDEINKENISVVKQMTFKPPVSDTSQESGAALHETSFARKMYVKLNRKIKYQDAGVSANPPESNPKDYTYQLLVAAYDTYTTLPTDLAGKMLFQHTLHFKDF